MRSFIASVVFLALAALPSAVAAPAPQRGGPPRGIQPPKFFNCPIKAGPDFPANQTALSIAPGNVPKFVALGTGVQNYTCTAGKFASAGAVADLFDTSCLVGTPLFKLLPGIAFAVNQRASAKSKITAQLGGGPFTLGKHIFITKPDGSGIAPLFDMAASQKKADAFVVGAKKAGIPSPAGATNVDWLELSRVDGALSTQVFRVDTKAGQPAATCTDGQTSSVPYSAMYWFYGPAA